VNREQSRRGEEKERTRGEGVRACHFLFACGCG
jgi:hypothetical protein